MEFHFKNEIRGFEIDPLRFFSEFSWKNIEESHLFLEEMGYSPPSPSINRKKNN